MRRFSFFTILTLVAVFCASTTLFAQSQIVDKFLISAKAGGVNHVEGSVTIMRSTGTAGVLLKRDRVEVGDRVTTGADGRAEILLNPGSFIRLSSNSSFEFGTTDLEDLQLTLDSGSAIFEVFAADEFRVSVSTPKGKVSLIETGIYRLDVSTSGTAILSVSKGKAEIGEKGATLIKEGRTGTVGTDTVLVAKFDKGKRDEFGNWSRERSKELTKLSSSLQDRQLNTALLRGFNRGLWSIYGSFGLWIYDASFGGHCFLPFGNNWRSPYGWWYRNGIYWNFPPPVWNPPVGSVPSTRKVREPGDIPTNPFAKVRGNDDQPVRTSTTKTLEPPPFAKVNRGSDFGGGATDGGTRNSNMKSADFNAPSFSPPAYSPPVSTPPPPPSTAKVREN